MGMANVLRLSSVALMLAVLIGCGSDKGTNSQTNQPPAAPSAPSPANGAGGQAASPTLLWQCSDPDNDPLTYDVYLGQTADPPLVASALDSAAYHAVGLGSPGTYHWKITAKDNKGHATTGPVWTFGTRTVLSRVGIYTTPGLIMGVALSGNYAYVLDDISGLHVLNVSNPSSPSLITTFSPLAQYACLCVSGTRLYLTGDAAPGNTQRSATLCVVDISNPASPAELGRFDTTRIAALGFGYLAASGSYVYCAETDGLMTFDVSNPASPRWVAYYEFASWIPIELVVRGQRLFIPNRNTALDIFSLANPANPRPDGMGITDLFYYYRGVAVTGQYAMVTGSAGSVGVVVFNVSDPRNITPVATFGDGYGGYSRIAISGTTAFLTSDELYMQVLDVSTPLSPLNAGTLTTFARLNGLQVSGDYVYAWDGDYGDRTKDTLRIFRFTP